MDQNFPEPEPEGGDICKVGCPDPEFQGSPPTLSEGGDQTKGGGGGSSGAKGAGGTLETGGRRGRGGAW